MVFTKALRLLRKTPVRTFIIFPLLTISWELFLNQGRLQVEPLFSLLMLWGYLQYRLCGRYRIKRGGGGPGLEIPPERLVATGPYAYARNPMYLGHIIFLTGVALTLKSWLGGLIVLIAMVGSHRRVLGDEKRLSARFGQPYIDYMGRVKRWIPGIFGFLILVLAW